MVFPKKILLLSFVATLMASPISAAVDSTFHIYLLFGQSNMAGGGAGNQNDKTGLLATDCDTNSRIKVLGFCNCATTDYSLGCSVYKPKRVDSLWYTAFQPLHICTEGISPGEYFARTMLDSVRSDIKIGLIPCALSGQALEVFIKDLSNFNIPTFAHPTLVNSSPYAWMLARCKAAQKVGVIKGALLHQGESNQGTRTTLSWIAMAEMIFDTLKIDLGVTDTLPNRFPFVVGELRKDAVTPTPCCAGFNTNIDSLAKVYKGCGLASSTGLSGNGADPYHFNCASMRELGRRYALALLALSKPSYIPRKGTSNTINDRVVMYQAMKSAASSIRVYSLNGRALKSYAATNSGNALRSLNAGGVYIVTRKLNDGRTAILPFIKE